MKSEVWIHRLDAAGTWLCEHTDQAGNPALPTRLSLAEARDANSDAPPPPGGIRLQCPDCGTYWRVWEHLHLAKYYVAPPLSEPVGVGDTTRYRYHRAQTLDIDRVLTAVANVLPGLQVSQWQQIWPADDDGLWWLSLPGTGDLHLESATGMCSFLIETEEQCGTNARTANTVAEVVSIVVEYLSVSYQGSVEPCF